MNRHEQIHYHWTFGAFEGTEPPSPTNPKWATTVTVVGYMNEAEAEVAARSIITRDTFMLTGVYECPSCGFQESAGESQRELIDMVKQSLK